MATTKKLIAIMRELGLSLPETGSGALGRVINSDLEDAIAAYYWAQAPRSRGYTMRMQLGAVMLAYNYKGINESDPLRKEVWESPEWFLEEKYNGCRAVITYNKAEGFGVFGRNRSKKDFLPIDYTSKVLIDGRLGNEYVDFIRGDQEFILDCELLTDGYVEGQSGYFSASNLNAVIQVLSLNDYDSIVAQKTTAPLYAKVFDCILFDNGQPYINRTLSNRKMDLYAILAELELPSLQESNIITGNKVAFYNQAVAAGKEGVIAKHYESCYMPGISGRRYKEACIKIKRSVVESSGVADIDAFVIGFTRGKEWDAQGMIAGLKLGVWPTSEKGTQAPRWIATVSGIPNEIRAALSVATDDGPALREEYMGKVLTIDGQHFTGRNQRLAHAVANWEVAFRNDKDASDCHLDTSFIESQMF